MDPKTGALVGETAAEQANRSSGTWARSSSPRALLADVVKATVYAKDMNDFQAVNEVYARFFDADPARVFIEWRGCRDVLVEVDAIAVKG